MFKFMITGMIGFGSVGFAGGGLERCDELRKYVFSGEPSISSPAWHCAVSNGAVCDMGDGPLASEWVDLACWHTYDQKWLAGTIEQRCAELHHYVFRGDSSPGSPMDLCEKGISPDNCASIKASPLGKDYVAASCWNYR